MSRLLARPLPPRFSAAVIAIAVGVVVLKAFDRPTDPREMISVHASIAPQRVEPNALDLDLLNRTQLQTSSADPFAIPAPPPEATKESAPVAPPLPFAYLGKVVDGGRTTVFVARGDENHALESGQTVAGTWKVDRITDKSVTFTYLPLRQKQTLAITAD
jgi:hypothetical protein